MPEAIITASELSKKYRLGRIGSASLYHTIGEQAKALFSGGRRAPGNDEFWALSDLNFEIKEGDVVGIVGRNGAGKSTLLKILSRITLPTKGKIELNGRVGALLEVGTGFHPELTGRENIFLNGSILGMKKEEIRSKFDEIVSFSGVERFLDTPVKRYSSGMYVRLAFAVAAHLEPEILVVDEVLAVGDTEFQKKCLGKMSDAASSGRTILFVSHNMAAVKTLCTRGFYLRDGKLEYDGAIHDVVDRYLDQNRASEKTYPDGPVRRISIAQAESAITIELEYSCEHPLQLPNLGFVINDSDGRPVFGGNPKMIPGNHHRSEPYPAAGIVKVYIDSPTLLDGTYTLSVWFGDKHEDYFSEPDCVSIEVIAMTSVSQLYKAQQIGSVVPRCSFSFTEKRH